MSGPEMWPRKLPRQVRENPLRSAEVKVYDLLAKQLGPEWTVFYSRPWLGLTPTGVEKDGEADFVVVHPVRGYLTIEVKGGAISYDPVTDQWRSRDRHQIDHKIKDPVGQACSAKHELLKKVKQASSWPHRFIRMRHGIVFPDSLPPDEALGPDKPREIFCCRGELATLDQWIRRRLASGDESEPGPAGVQAFRDVLAKPFELSVPLAHYLDDDDQEIALLTPEQFHILNAVEEGNRIAAGGGAGTGKTVLAVEDATRRSRSGLKTALICVSARLAGHLNERVAGTGVDVWSLDKLCDHLAGQAGLSIPKAGYRNDDIANTICRAVRQRPDLKYDAVIVDEGQDIRSGWWAALEDLLKAPKTSYLHVYFDTNQTVYGDVSRELASFSFAPVRLTRNLRNTRRIHSAASRFYSGAELRPDGPEGTPLEWIEATARNADLKALEVVRRLTGEDMVNPENVIVLCADQQMKETLETKLAAFEGVEVELIQDFKGLEKPVVILVASREMADVRELAYVALSRPRVLLKVVGEPAMLDWLGREGE